MIKNPVCLVQRSVKKVRSIEEKNLLIHGCKGKERFRISDVRFWILFTFRISEFRFRIYVNQRFKIIALQV